MKEILKDYYQIFLSCPIGGLMKAAQTRIVENVQIWSRKSYEEMPDLDEVKDFIEISSCPIFPEFIEKVLQPIIDLETEKGEMAAREYKEELLDEGIIYEES